MFLPYEYQRQLTDCGYWVRNVRRHPLTNCVWVNETDSYKDCNTTWLREVSETYEERKANMPYRRRPYKSYEEDGLFEDERDGRDFDIYLRHEKENEQQRNERRLQREGEQAQLDALDRGVKAMPPEPPKYIEDAEPVKLSKEEKKKRRYRSRLKGRLKQMYDLLDEARAMPKSVEIDAFVLRLMAEINEEEK